MRVPLRFATPPCADAMLQHLDIESVDALVQGLSLFRGGVLLVSHDEHLILNAAVEIWNTPGDGSVTPWRASFADYKKALVGR